MVVKFGNCGLSIQVWISFLSMSLDFFRFLAISSDFFRFLSISLDVSRLLSISLDLRCCFLSSFRLFSCYFSSLCLGIPPGPLVSFVLSLSWRGMLSCLRLCFLVLSQDFSECPPLGLPPITCL